MKLAIRAVCVLHSEPSLGPNVRQSLWQIIGLQSPPCPGPRAPDVRRYKREEEKVSNNLETHCQGPSLEVGSRVEGWGGVCMGRITSVCMGRI